MSEKLNFDILDVQPFVRFVAFYTNKSEQHVVPKRKLYDYSLLYVVNGTMCFRYDGKEVVLNKGDMHMMPPNLYHEEFIPKGKRCDYYVIHFDMFFSRDRMDFDMHEMYLKYCTKYIEVMGVDPKYLDMFDKNIALSFKSPILKHPNSEEVVSKFGFLNGLFCRYKNTQDPHYQIYMRSLMSELIAVMFENFVFEDNKYHQSVANELINYIDQSYNEKIDIDALAKKVGFTPNYLRRIFKQQIGLTIHEFLRNKQIDMSKKMLIETNLPINEISYKVGINDSLYFSKIFKNQNGCSPKEYRKKFRN